MNLPELLVPAGDMEKLRTALNYGADAVYIGGERFGLRALAHNFSLDDIECAVELAKERKRRLYLTLNAYLKPEETEPFLRYVEALRPLGIDAYIVSDPGVLSLVKQVDPERPLHLSTQANTTNAAAADFWRGQGVSRVNLARELTLDEIRIIASETDTELEVFVHGALCVAYSGRCLLSASMTDRSANAGACSHPCRWKYALVEETRPEESYPVEEDRRGTYILNSRDLCLIDHIPELVSAGISALKIEGRMKSLYYVAAVTRVYREALDRYAESPNRYAADPLWREELEKVSHRPYGTGFLFGNEDPQIHRSDSHYLRGYDFVGVVDEALSGGRFLVQGRNRFFAGEELEILGPAMRTVAFAAGELRAPDETILAAGQPNARIVMDLPLGSRPGDLLRKKRCPTTP